MVLQSVTKCYKVLFLVSRSVIFGVTKCYKVLFLVSQSVTKCYKVVCYKLGSPLEILGGPLEVFHRSWVGRLGGFGGVRGK